MHYKRISPKKYLRAYSFIVRCLHPIRHLNTQQYGFTNDYYIIFELYNQNPMKEENNSWIKDEKLSPIYAASTDKKGQYSGKITIPSDITEIWIYSDYPGAVSPVKLAVSNEEINFDQAEYIASLQTNTRATTAGGYSYPERLETHSGYGLGCLWSSSQYRKYLEYATG